MVMGVSTIRNVFLTKYADKVKDEDTTERSVFLTNYVEERKDDNTITIVMSELVYRWEEELGHHNAE